MPSSPLLAITEMTANQSQKEVTFNDAILALEGAGNATLAVSMAGGDVTLSVNQFTRNFIFNCSGQTAGRTLNIPALVNGSATSRVFTVRNSSVTYTVKAQITGGAGGFVTVPASATYLLTADGSGNILVVSTSLTPNNDISLAADSATEVPSQHAVKAYVDGRVAGLVWKAPVRAATTANGTLATAYENGDTIDGVTLVTGDRILLKNQTAGAENGIYVVAASGAPARATDADSAAEMLLATVKISEGSTLADSEWTCTTNAPITLGTTALVFATPPTATSITAKDEGGTLTAAMTSVDFVGAGVVATNTGGAVIVTIDSATLLRLISTFFTTAPTASEVLALYISADAFTIAANMAGSQVSVGTNPAATFAIDLQKNGSTIGTISISTSGVATLTTTSGTSKSIAIGDVLKIVAPATPDASIANVAINLKGTL